MSIYTALLIFFAIVVLLLIVIKALKLRIKKEKKEEKEEEIKKPKGKVVEDQRKYYDEATFRKATDLLMFMHLKRVKFKKYAKNNELILKTDEPPFLVAKTKYTVDDVIVEFIYNGKQVAYIMTTILGFKIEFAEDNEWLKLLSKLKPEDQRDLKDI